MLNEVKHIYNKNSSLPLRLRSGLKVQDDSVEESSAPGANVLSESFGAIFSAFAKYSLKGDFDCLNGWRLIRSLPFWIIIHSLVLYLCKDNFALLISKHIIWFLTCFSSRTAVQIIAGHYSYCCPYSHCRLDRQSFRIWGWDARSVSGMTWDARAMTRGCRGMTRGCPSKQGFSWRSQGSDVVSPLQRVFSWRSCDWCLLSPSEGPFWWRNSGWWRGLSIKRAVLVEIMNYSKRFGWVCC